jgi:hypothetical protein
VLTSLAKKGYFGGFYFWLDFIATVSLLFDIPAVMTLLTPVGAGQTSGQGGTLARAGRSANAGSKMGRILRLVRVIRMMRLIHRYEQRVKAARRASAAAKAAGTTLVAPRIVHPRLERNTRVGEKLSDLTTRCGAWHAHCDALGACSLWRRIARRRRVIVGVLLILCATPLFDVRFFPAGDVYSFEARCSASTCFARCFLPACLLPALTRHALYAGGRAQDGGHGVEGVRCACSVQQQRRRPAARRALRRRLPRLRGALHRRRQGHALAHRGRQQPGRHVQPHGTFCTRS